MAYRYYFLNGKLGHGKALFLPEKGVLRRDFTDISNIDLITLNIKKKDMRDVIGDYNRGEDISGAFYDASYPRGLSKLRKGEIDKPETDIQPAIFDFSSERTEYYLDKLKEYAEERNYKAEHGINVKLDETVSFNCFIENLLYRIFDDFDERISSYESLVGLPLKDRINNRFDEYKDMDTCQYVQRRLKTMRDILSNYTQLRILILEYLCLKENYNPNLRGVMNNISTWKHENMTPFTKNINSREEYRQLVLSDFMELTPKTK